MKTGDKVKFTGASIEQTRWGSNDDPYKFLIEGDEVTVRDVEVHSWHTKLYFVEIPGKYNSVCFEPVAILTLPEEKHGFCENPDSKCTMNYCDENGCIERKRNLVDANLTLAPEEKKNTMENMTKEQDDELKQDIHAFTLVKALDLLDDCHHYLKANPPSKETMNYNKWENLVEETDYMREYNANAAYERANPDDNETVEDGGGCFVAGSTKEGNSGSVAAPKEESLQWPSKIELPNHSEKLESENTALREALKELLPIAEGMLLVCHKIHRAEIKAIIERARKLISK